MKDLRKQMSRINKIRQEVRESQDYRIEAAKLAFSERILERLEALGITRTELARRTGVSGPYITKILRGTTNFTLDSMIKIADALDCEFVQELRPNEQQAVPANARTGGIRKAARPRSRRSSRKQSPPAMVREPATAYGKKKGETGKPS